MDTWTIIAVDPDHVEEERGTVATLHGATRVEALVRGCEAVADGWADVEVVGSFTTYRLTDPATNWPPFEVTR